MKYSRLFAALIVLLCVCCLRAQTHYEGNIFVGGRAGASLSRVQFYPAVGQSWQPGAVVGLTCRYIEEEHFGIQAELNFEQRGWREKYKDRPELSYSRTINYLQIPVLAHIYFGSRRTHFFVNAGPEVGFKLGDTTSSNFDYEHLENVPSFPTGRQVAQLTAPLTGVVDFGISGGLGCEYYLDSKQSINLEARFYYGLGNVMKCGRTETFSGANSMSLMLTLGYSFRLK